MEFDANWILLGLPIAFAFGWLASRFDLRQLRMENRQAPKAYFKGLNFLLNEQQDQAIDAFIEAVQNDPDTSELHFALGNLFRRRGEYERAVRVHEHLLSRGDISATDHQRAQHALALDYLKAGLLDRAEDALLKLEGTPFENEARLARLAICERSREWPQAAELSRKLEAADEASFAGRLAHYLCEQALAATAKGDTDAARALLEQAIADAPQAARPRIQLAALQRTQGMNAESLQTLETLLQTIPAAAPLVAVAMAQTALACTQGPRILGLLQAMEMQSPSLDITEAIVTLKTALHTDVALARAAYLRHLEKEPSLITATRWIAGEKLEDDAAKPLVQRALDRAARPLSRYRCAACGFEVQEHFWNCPGCQAWDSFSFRRVEEL